MEANDKSRLDAGRPADENYLKAVLQAHMDRGRAYVSDLADILNISLSASYATANRLIEAGLIQPLERRGGRRSNRQTLMLTPAGKEQAERTLRKHFEIKTWLVLQGVSENEAEDVACHWEHRVSAETMEIVQNQIEKAQHRKKRGRPPKRDTQETACKKHQEVGNITFEGMIALFDKHGGLEEIQRREQLIERAGGIERLTEILDLIDAMGGYRTLSREGGMMQELKEIVCRRAGGVDRLEETLDLVDAMGGVRKLKAEKDMLLRLKDIADQRRGEERLVETLQLFDSLGGTQPLTKFKELSDSMGGVKNALWCLSQSYKMWSSLLKSRSNPEK